MNLYFKARDGLWYEDAKNYLWVGILGGCGCGYSDILADEAYNLLKYFGTPHSERDLQFFHGDNNLLRECIAHWLDNKELIEHGTSITGAWLTANGEKLLDYLKMEIEQDDTK